MYHTAKLVINADDTSVSSVLVTAENINVQIKSKTTLDCMSEWFLANGLTLNINKTNIVKFRTKNL